MGLRGWADRLAERLTVHNPGLEYANLAVRGRRAEQVRAEQLGPALALRPDLATVVAGFNDLLGLRFDADESAGHLEAMFAALTAQGARVATLTFPDLARLAPVARPVSSRIDALNRRIRQAASRHGVAVAEIACYPAFTDPWLWSPDRLHAGPRGHARVAAAVAHALGLPGSDDSWTLPLPAQQAPAWQRATVELRWFTAHFAPWLLRCLLGRSAGDGRTAKRPHPLPLLANESAPPLYVPSKT